MENLKPCPFTLCNGKAVITPEGDFHEAHCIECGCSVQAHTYEEVERLWNTRQPRFTEVDREAMEITANLAYNYVKGFDNGRSFLENGKGDLGKDRLGRIATVRKMLEDTV